MGSIRMRKGRMENKRTVPLSLFYLKYFAFLFLGILVIVSGAVLVFEILVLNDAVYPANYTEQRIKEAAGGIAGAQEVSRELIPDLCQYAVFDENGEAKGGDIEKAGIEDAWNAVLGRRSDVRGYYYSVVERDEEYCVLRYEIIPQFRSPVLRRYLPGPQNLFFAAGLCLILLLVVITALCFGHTLQKKLTPLISAAEKIRNQELEFDISSSNVREIAAVLKAMDDMRAALKVSLENQWKTEQRKKEQILALAHDLKTPLTLIRGNAELLCDTKLTEEQGECVDLIEKNSLRMQNYVQMLMEVTKDGYVLRPQKIETAALFREVGEQLKGLCVVKKISLQESFECRVSSFSADRELFMRALMNIASNAVEYTPEGGRIYWEVSSAEEMGSMTGMENEVFLLFSITDTGKGFSADALKYAAGQFYMEDRSRHTNAHYGIGLFMADLAAKQHGGQLLLENSSKTGGARVTMKIPVKQFSC